MTLDKKHNAHLQALTTSLLWSFSFISLREVLTQMSVSGFHHLVAAQAFFQIRMLITAIAFLPLVWRHRTVLSSFKKNDWLLSFAICITMTYGYHFPLNLGAAQLPSGLVSLIVALNPLITGVLAFFLLKETLGPIRIASILIGALGIFTCLKSQGLISPQLLESIPSLVAPAWVLLAAIDASFFNILGRKTRSHQPISLLLGISMIMTVLLGIPLWTPTTIHAVKSLDGKGWIALFYLSIPATVITNILWYKALRVLDAVQVTIYLNLMAMLALLWGAIIYHEKINLLYLAGAGCIMGGVLLAAFSSPPATSRSATP